MKTLCPAILGLEAVSLLLAILVVLSLTSAGAVGVATMAGIAAIALVDAALFRRDPHTGVLVGWGVQVLAVLSGLLVPAMFAVGVIFAAVWWAAVHFGGKVDRLRAADGGQGRNG